MQMTFVLLDVTVLPAAFRGQERFARRRIPKASGASKGSAACRAQAAKTREVIEI